MSRASPEAAPSDEPVSYPVKWTLTEKNESIPVIMQARNGPCALLALANINLQTRAFALEPGTTSLREEYLMYILADYVSTRPAPTPTSDPSAVWREHAVGDFLDLLPRLNRGMDINVRFDAPTSFEFTRELGVFDIFPNVRLLHGWLVDPQDARLSQALGKLSYNQVIDELVRTATPAPAPPPEEEVQTEEDEMRHVPSAPPPEAFEPSAPAMEPEQASEPMNLPQSPSPMPELPEETVHTAAIREVRTVVLEFLESTSTQLTVYGLTELHSSIADNELVILFRNSHFHVVKKRNGELFTLVTDVGYLNELNTVWEKLSDVNGDSTFYNGSFQRLNAYGLVTGGAAAASTQTPKPAMQPQKPMGHRPRQASRPVSSTHPSPPSPPSPPYMPGNASARPHVHASGGSPSRRRHSQSVADKVKNSDKCVIQ